ncbi:MAG: tyrosine-type recombinase/integrase [Clostridiales bacterium]|jgi:integrase|nr:tyrosine-type recombinase/integrase [Clostridiales bacterium]
MEEEKVQGNPILKNLRVREEPKFPAPLNDEEQHILQETLESKEQHINLAFQTMLATGIRVGEAVKHTRKDIRLDNNRVVLFIRKAKGGKSRKNFKFTELKEILTETQPSDPELAPTQYDNVIYTVRVGAFNIRTNAENLKLQLK